MQISTLDFLSSFDEVLYEHILVFIGRNKSKRNFWLIRSSCEYLKMNSNIFQSCLWTKQKNLKKLKQVSLWIQGLFLFSIIWGLGGTLNSDGRKKFDVFLREILNSSENKPKSIKLSKVNWFIVFPEMFSISFYNFRYFFSLRITLFPNVALAMTSFLRKKREATGKIGLKWS